MNAGPCARLEVTKRDFKLEKRRNHGMDAEVAPQCVYGTGRFCLFHEVYSNTTLRGTDAVMSGGLQLAKIQALAMLVIFGSDTIFIVIK